MPKLLHWKCQIRLLILMQKSMLSSRRWVTRWIRWSLKWQGNIFLLNIRTNRRCVQRSKRRSIWSGRRRLPSWQELGSVLQVGFQHSVAKTVSGSRKNVMLTKKTHRKFLRNPFSLSIPKRIGSGTTTLLSCQLAAKLTRVIKLSMNSKNTAYAQKVRIIQLKLLWLHKTLMIYTIER